jgi:hypothetical protein
MSIPQNSENHGGNDTPRNRRTRVLFIESDGGDSPTGRSLGIDLSGIDNYNSQSPLKGVIRTKCDLGHWHSESEVTLQPWSSE